LLDIGITVAVEHTIEVSKWSWWW